MKLVQREDYRHAFTCFSSPPMNYKLPCPFGITQLYVYISVITHCNCLCAVWQMTHSLGVVS